MDGITTLAFALVIVIPLWRIFERAGMQPAISLVALVPVVGLVVAALILAFGQWSSPMRDPRQPDLFERGRR
jgi:hypothetical protein